MSRLIPFVTMEMSIPHFSHKFAISFTKLIFVAKNAFDAYLIISAVSIFVTRTGVLLSTCSRYISLTMSAAVLLSAPITILSGKIKSLTAAPSLRNSGFDTTSKPNSIFRFSSIEEITSLTFCPVPTGTVLLLIITL